MIISTITDKCKFQELLGDGSKFGISLTYEVQEKPEGIVQAFLIGEKFISNSHVSLILGDNLFHGSSLMRHLLSANSRKSGATIFPV